MRLVLATVILLGGMFSSASAQPAEPAEPTKPTEPTEPAESNAPVPPPTGATAPAGDSAELVAVYKRAFQAMVAGELATARTLFRQVAAESIESERAAAAREMVRLATSLLERGLKRELTPPSALTPLASNRAPARLLPDERPDSGRTSFIISTTLASTYAGVVLIDVTDVDDLRPAVVLLTGATAVGLLSSLYGSRGKTITAATSDAYTTGMWLGAANALLLFTPAGIDGSEAIQGTTLAALSVGGAVGMSLGRSAKPTRAQVGFVSTSAMLGIATVGLGLLAIDADNDDDTELLLLAGGLDAGAAVGMAVAPGLRWSVSRGRLVTLGMWVGGLAGWGTAALLTGDGGDSNIDVARAWSISTMAGMWGGFGLAIHVTRDMEPDLRYQPQNESRVQAQLLPTMINGAPGLAAIGRF